MQHTHFITVTVEQVPAELSDMLSSSAISEFPCTGVQEVDSLENQITGDLPDSLKIMSGGMNQGHADLVEEHIFNHELKTLKFFFEGEIELIQSESREFSKILMEQFQLSSHIEVHENEEWRDSWKENFKKIEVNSSLEVVPSWEKPEKDKSIIIEPGLGFGTGTHETTFLCLSILDEINFNGDVLDLGCGSGILGIYTQKYKNYRCDYVDVDNDALENCEENLRLNHIQENYKILNRDQFDSQRTYGLVIANILRPILLAESDLIANALKDGGKVLLSGIIEEQVDEITSHFQKYSNINKVTVKKSKNDWVALVLE